MENAKTKGWFEDLYGKGKDFITMMNKGNKRKSLKLRFEDYYNKLDVKASGIETSLLNLRQEMSENPESVGDAKMNQLMQLLEDTKQVNIQKEAIRAEYLGAFSKEMRIEEE